MPLEVRFGGRALRDLEEIGDYIARDSRANAVRFLDQIESFCRRLAEFPDKGRLRPDIAPEIRTFSFHRRVSIAYHVEGRQLVVLRIVYAGQQFGDAPD